MIDISDLENQQEDQVRPTLPQSWVSQHYSRQLEGDSIKRQCLAHGCQKSFGDKISHTALKRHWQRKHDAQIIMKPTTYTFHDEQHIDNLIKMVIDTQSEYALVDRQSFREFARSLSSSKRLICSKTLSRIVEAKKDSLRELIKKSLVDEVALSLTFDIWSPKKGASGYGCVTAHFINKDWILQSLILEFGLMPHPHNGSSICGFIKEVALDFNIQDKIVAITTDNGSNVVAGIRLLESDLGLSEKFGDLKFTHFRCLGHVIHLAVQQALKGLKPVIVDARRFVAAIKSSAKRNEAFIRGQQLLIDLKDPRFQEDKPLELIDDVESRWNATYLMLQRLVRLKRPSQEAFANMADIRELTGLNWDQLEELVKFLKPLYSLTNKFSGEKYCTISLVSSLIPRVVGYLDQEFDDAVIRQAASDLSNKLGMFMEFIHQEVVLVANILDPRFKSAGLTREALENGSNFIRQIIGNDHSLSMDNSGSSQDEPDFFDDLFASGTEDELQSFLASPREEKKSDIMTSWRALEQTFPKLAHLARKVLPIQATSTASERTFSVAGETLTERRNRLHPENFKANVLNKSWLTFLSKKDPHKRL